MAPQSNTVPANVTKEMAESILVQFKDETDRDMYVAQVTLEIYILRFLADNNLRIVHR